MSIPAKPESERITLRMRRKAITREKVFRAAKKLFAEKGYEKTRSGDIAKSAGVSHGTVFAHFSAKSEILQQMQDEFLAFEIMQIANLSTDDLSCEESLKLMVKTLWKGAMKNMSTCRAILSQSWLWTKERECVYQKLTERLRGYGVDYLRKGQQSTEISPDLDVVLTMQIIDAVLCECLRKTVIDPDKADMYLLRVNKTIRLVCAS